MCLIDVTASTNINSQKAAHIEMVYIQPWQISFEQGKIFVDIDNVWIPISAIQSNAQGIFVKIEYWTCNKCCYGFNPPWTALLHKSLRNNL